MQQRNPCFHCGQHMDHPRRKQCGKPECFRAYNNHRNREFQRRWREEHGEWYADRYEYHRQRGTKWRAANPEGARRLWRKDRARRRAAERGAQAEDFTHEEIFDRDAWVCQLCRKRIGKTYRYPHPRSASLDHVVPLIDGGEHTRANVQAAHLACNLSKNARGGGEQLRLV